MLKIKSHFVAIVMLATALTLAGCATSEVAKYAKGTGVKKVYDKPESTVWHAMKAAITITDGEIVEENQQECTIYANYGVSWFSWGERVGVFCAAQGGDKTEAEVVSKRAVRANVTADDLTEDIFKALDEELK